MSGATACMPLVPASPLHGSAPIMERRQSAAGAMETTETGSEGTPGCVVRSHVYGNEDDRAGDDECDVVSKPRAVVQTLTCERKPLCEGFAFWRGIGRPELEELDPILSLDEFEFSAPAGFPDHPHRGFENVTYMLEGGVSYHDFSGHKGTINPGDVQEEQGRPGQGAGVRRQGAPEPLQGRRDQAAAVVPRRPLLPHPACRWSVVHRRCRWPSVPLAAAHSRAAEGVNSEDEGGEDGGRAGSRVGDNWTVGAISNWKIEGATIEPCCHHFGR